MSTTYHTTRVSVNWLPLLPGERDLYGDAQELEVSVLVPEGFDGKDLTAHVEEVARVVGVDKTQA